MKSITLLTAGFATFATGAWAQTEIQFWHAMGGRLGEVVEELRKNTTQAKPITSSYRPIKADTKTR